MKTVWKADSPWLLLTLLATSAGTASADEAPESDPERVDAALDMEFLEYLGSWETSDEEWILFAGDEIPPEARTDPAPEREESVESSDEE